MTPLTPAGGNGVMTLNIYSAPPLGDGGLKNPHILARELSLKLIIDMPASTYAQLFCSKAMTMLN